jgi:hypothetical protein
MDNVKVQPNVGTRRLTGKARQRLEASPRPPIHEPDHGRKRNKFTCNQLCTNIRLATSVNQQMSSKQAACLPVHWTNILGPARRPPLFLWLAFEMPKMILSGQLNPHFLSRHGPGPHDHSLVSEESRSEPQRTSHCQSAGSSSRLWSRPGRNSVTVTRVIVRRNPLLRPEAAAAAMPPLGCPASEGLRNWHGGRAPQLARGRPGGDYPGQQGAGLHRPLGTIGP